MRSRLLALVATLGVAGATLGVTTGTASAMPNTGSGTRWLCEFFGGTYVQDMPGVFWCWFPDGSAVVCVDGECGEVPATRPVAPIRTVRTAPLAAAALAV